MKSTIPFIGRKKEFTELQFLLKKKTASIAVIQGRRRIGKSRLIREFAKSYSCFYSFTGMPPNVNVSTTGKNAAQLQREEFVRQFREQFDLPLIESNDWGELLSALAKFTARGRVIILLDEISWMCDGDTRFLGKLKNVWDLKFSQNPQLILILCGSVSSWIDKNIINNTGFVGRISLTINLKELSIPECNQFFKALRYRGVAYDKFKILAVTGGVPRYLEEMQSSLNAEGNIKRLCFKDSGVLFREFEQIFSDLFSRRNVIYKKIVKILADGHLEFNDICKKLRVAKSGLISEYLEELIKAGFIRRDFTWHLKSKEEARLSHYRLSDNYLRFYLKYVEKNYSKIESCQFDSKSLANVPGWDAIMSLQFENLVLNNREFVLEKLHIYLEDIVSDNPFFQRKTARNKGCQIDYLIQTKYNTLFVCEIKFSRQEIKRSIIDEMQHKIERLTVPKGFSCYPVLIHINGVNEDVVDSGYFTSIIDFSELLQDAN